MTPRQIVTEIVDLERRRAEAVKAHEATLNALDARIDTIRRACEHALVKYHPDASGNNETNYECELCGAELPTMPRKAPGASQDVTGTIRTTNPAFRGAESPQRQPDALPGDSKTC